MFLQIAKIPFEKPRGLYAQGIRQLSRSVEPNERFRSNAKRPTAIDGLRLHGDLQHRHFAGVVRVVIEVAVGVSLGQVN
jgi:hypothetical protein